MPFAIPFHALLPGLVCALAYAVSALAAHRSTRAALVLAWLLHALLLGVGLGLWHDEPHFGFAPALSVTVWLVVAIYAVEARYYPALQARRALPAPLATLSLLAVLLSLVFPGQAITHQGALLLPLHWALGIASYGLFAVAVVHALLMLRAETRIRHASESDSGLPLMTLERLTFRFVAAGFALLTATLAAGFLFDERLYGTSWNWNHKMVFSVLSWAVFAVLLYGRWQLGWRGWRAARWLFTGAGLLLLAYVGSRFVLEIVLHRAPLNA
ncbi:cytochrome C assembly protein [Hylemonella gracilis str. Niagara R]|uniref:Cytochrome C assembly protein n=1 Tax=Hylemonella gracilis str. Niagara R TaxID=1458275 RepID=A0A016XMF0_9BURK|nr:cytochrome c biogenesis protein CcsA [Hylemonella gracilis]EYC52393.1 cytochrome C assembly protein [Hylemonella gracilis str. Niagara R]